jgi:chitinase
MMPEWQKLLIMAAVVAAALPGMGQTKPASHSAERPQIIAYIFPRDHRIEPGEVAAAKLTRINYAFANIKDGQIVAESPADAPNFATLVALKHQNPSLEVLVSVGGWLWSGNFSDMALTRASRARFIDSVAAFLRQYKLDGLDVDWEFPGQVGAGNRFRPEDKENYTLLLRELRQRFDREQRVLKRRLLLSVAAGAGDDFLEHTQMGSVATEVDTVNLMAYDFYEPDSDKITGNHAPLYHDPADPKAGSADDSVHGFERAGVPARKIVLGVPFYGHVWGNVGPANHGLFQPGSPVPNAFAHYGDIASTLLHQGFTRYWDAPAQVPYLYNEQTKQFVSYEDPVSLAVKCAYVRREGLGGVMFWEYSADPSGALLDTIHRAFSAENGANAGGAQ